MLRQVLGEGMQRQIASHGTRDASGQLILPLTFESLEVACGRVLSFGPAVEVVSPAALRDRVARHAAAVAARYRRTRKTAPRANAERTRPRVPIGPSH